LAANLLCAEMGAQIFRVHDVADHRGAFSVKAALGGGPAQE
jgi:dihydropteroate synthase